MFKKTPQKAAPRPFGLGGKPSGGVVRKAVWDDDDDEEPANPPKRRMLGEQPTPVTSGNGFVADEDGPKTSSGDTLVAGDGPEANAGDDFGGEDVAKAGEVAGGGGDDDDPLDAFMAGISEEMKHEVAAPKAKTVRRDDLEEDDFVESYIKHMKDKGIEVGKGGGVPGADGGDVDSDEEVYATARAVDAAAGPNDELDELSAAVDRKRDIEPLPPVDHSKIQYLEIEKDFYEEHEDIARLSDVDVWKIRQELDMRVMGTGIAKPCISFAHFGFDDALINAVIKQGYSQPSGIQQQAVPVALSGRDIIGIAKTGSGKTAAFIWPMLVHMMDQPELEKGDGPIGLILAPTRELAAQIHTEAKKFAKCYGLKVSVVYGGASKGEQFKELRPGGVEILVATPGRLIDLIKMKATNLRRVSFLVLDEADRMFDLGFEPQVRSICNNIRPDRQTLLFSATFQKRVERLARDALTDPIRISIGNVGVANSDVTQNVVLLDDDGFKWNWLISRLPGFSVEGSVLVFISRKAGVDELCENLKQAGFDCAALHGDMMQHDRDRVIHEFKTGKFKVLISTDVAARGLDIKSIKNVVNYDVARDIDSHVHRIGRTGRAGEKGTAYTLITQKEDKFAGEL
ncbi:hypothetical protein HK104_004065, partial [Borealophlyctis nickersoniae]